MDDQLFKFINKQSFPCIMAKAVMKRGRVDCIKLPDMLDSEMILHHMYKFIDQFKLQPEKLSSLIFQFTDERLLDFETFEEKFWNLLRNLSALDRKLYAHDERVDDNPDSPRFSFSIMAEAFFILALHPQSARVARRFHQPLIVFNPHIQFEQMRQKKIFNKIRNLIRKKDKQLQPEANPMLSDFGESSEVFQYLGKAYPANAVNPLLIKEEEVLWKSFSPDMGQVSL
ncbi:MAG: YqcI/YcgG family protein [Bdellovibrionales bacterium]|nr:YqcI/YcgG family protein [Bdellovibrionales bacterium]